MWARHAAGQVSQIGRSKLEGSKMSPAQGSTPASPSRSSRAPMGVARAKSVPPFAIISAGSSPAPSEPTRAELPFFQIFFSGVEKEIYKKEISI